MPEGLILILLFVLGGSIGSFLNVCIVRIPEKLSIVVPPSHCPKCKKPIAFYDNIPLASYIILGGRCRHCKQPIPFRYFVVELLTAAVLPGLYCWYGLTLPLALSFIFCAALIIITFIDLQLQIIPDVISLPGIPLCFLCSFVVPWTTPLESGIGIFVGGGVLYGVAAGYYYFRKKEGMGGGDIKLLAMIGAFLGWKGALVALVVGAFAGSIIGVTVMLLKGKDMKYAIPFGPFLSLGALASLLYGSALLHWYLTLGRG
jgi:leader peptidase (prepilin peptidase) / N-methyltransferase